VEHRTSATARGRAGEEAAARFLETKGYRIIARNVRFRTGEIDLIADENGVLVFVEVKTRSGSDFGTAAEAVTGRKQQQLVRLASLFLAQSGSLARPCRFDVVAVEPAPTGEFACTLFTNAFAAR